MFSSTAKVHRALADVLARGSGIQGMAQAIVRLSGCPAFVADTHADVIAHEQRPGTPLDREALKRALCEAVSADLDRLAERYTRGERTAGFILDVSDRRVHAVAAPVIVGGEVFGWVGLAEPTWPPDEHDLAQHRVIAEQGAMLSGSEMLRQLSVRDAEERARGDFVDALVHGRFSDPHELAARARSHQFDVDARYAVHVVTSPALLRAHGQRRVHNVGVAVRLIQGAGDRKSRATYATVLAAMLVVVRELKRVPSAHVDAALERQETRLFAEHIHRVLTKQFGEDVRVAYGRPGQGAPGIAASYREARISLGLIPYTDSPAVSGYDDLRVYATIRELAATPQGKQFAAEDQDDLRRHRRRSKCLHHLA